MQKKREFILSMWQLKKEDENAQECLMCREKFSQQSDMAYLAKLSMDESFTTSYHGKDIKSGICLETCHHAVHSECFLAIKKNDQQEFKCPLCSAKCNIILPNRITKNRRLLRQCENILNSLFVQKYKSLDFASLLPLLFKHLIFSLGLDSITRPSLFHKTRNQRNKTNILLITLLFDYLLVMEEEGMEELEEEYEAFMNEVSGQN